ncbi:MAG: FAD-dependent oxidoreductase [Steroidobacteraceae bacterium]|jgi:2,4-dienoyl-CoA reductase-like NADH-dependent reductase (Old Yellow Enzyme family)/thioredoxin reductase|nr:FAD-dependent oxidoreductase [Steroidobacteraceae bacterium]
MLYENDAAPARYRRLFQPLTVGTLQLRNRVMLPPHASAVGTLWGTQADADRHVAYWVARVKAGAAWIDGTTGYIENLVIPGFEPTGVGARRRGVFRLPIYLDRAGQYAEAIHAAGACATTQIVIQGGMPHGPSPTLSGPVINSVPHALDRDEIRWFIAEYRYCAEQARRAGLDGVELHANHDDLLEWFLSPLTNRRTDEYGGSPENRLRFLGEILSEIREGVGRDFTVGIRMNLLEETPGGYDAAGGVELAQRLEATGLVDYLHVVMGSPWGNPSYIQPHYYEAAEWSALAGRLKAAVRLPIVHTGRINSPEVAERVLAAGHADVVGMARAHIADAELLAKARAGREDEIRPCIGCNECISRSYVEGLPFACTVNPRVGLEGEGPLPRVTRPRRMLVVGGGPAGLETAGLAVERGYEVELWEREAVLGGQARVTTHAPRYGDLARWLDWQERRLARAGVAVRREREAGADAVVDAGADVVVIATGARPRRPPLPGADAPFVHDIRDLLTGRAQAGRRVAIVAQDDHMAPLTLADFLSERGHEVTVVYPTNGPAPLVGRYILGAILGRLGARDVRFRCMEAAVAIEPGALRVRHVYAGVEKVVEGFDSIALACGGVPDATLYAALKGRVPALHVLGDAYAPRRIVFATRQAHSLVASL